MTSCAKGAKPITGHKGQLYSIVIGHAGDKEDWRLYNHFLESIQFED